MESDYEKEISGSCQRTNMEAVAGKWMTIESAPKDGTEVLLYYPECGGKKVWPGRYFFIETFEFGVLKHSNQGWATDMPATFFLKNPLPTHWMPFPPMPERGDSNSQAGIIVRVEKMREECRSCLLEDHFLVDGTKVYSKEQGATLLAAYDALLAQLKHQPDKVEVCPATRPV